MNDTIHATHEQTARERASSPTLAADPDARYYIARRPLAGTDVRGDRIPDCDWCVFLRGAEHDECIYSALSQQSATHASARFNEQGHH